MLVPRPFIGALSLGASRRKRAKDAVLENSSLLRTVLDCATEVAIMATDPGLTIKVFNAGAERLLGYRSEELVSRLTPSFIYDAAEIEAAGREIFKATGDQIDGWALLVEPTMLNKPREWTYVCKDGCRITVSQVVSAMHAENGSLLGYLIVAQDVTRQKQYEQSLRDAARKAEEASRAKSEFVANMSHEIRTPANAVVGLCYLLEQTPLDSQQSAVLGNINHASKALLSVINDVLDLSKIEAGEINIERAAFSPVELIRQLADVAAIQASAKGVHFRLDMPPDLPAVLEGDAKLLNQILSNLLTNAVKFTDRGRVQLAVLVSNRTADEVALNFSVQDTGIGISTEAQGRLFAPFAQADASITRRYGGTGLGLSIVKSLVGRLGGSVQLKSTAGIGSEFIVSLRFALGRSDPSKTSLPKRPKRPKRGDRPLEGVRILVVDDSDINLHVTNRILELNGAKVTLAGNGLEALELLRRRPAAHDLVLMDVQMPVLDGHAATRKIRETDALVDLPVVGLTAGALSSERQRAVASGMDDLIIKPFDADMLISSILRHVNHDRLAEPNEADDGWPRLHGIDREVARGRMVGDLNLFMSCLRRFLAEFGDIDAAAVTSEMHMNVPQAQRMHKLKGTAGMLGAKLIEALASRCEAAWRSGNLRDAASIGAQLCVEIQSLRQSAASVLAEDPCRIPDPASTTEGQGLQGDLLGKLVAMLRAQDLGAVDLFNSMAGALRDHLGRRAFESVRNLMDQLLLIEAADALGFIRPDLHDLACPPLPADPA
jgi:PAS domain S-box-containing protein